MRRLRRICIVQIQPRKHALDHADCTDPTRPHELDRSCYAGNRPALQDLDYEVGMICMICMILYDLSEVWKGGKSNKRAHARFAFLFPSTTCTKQRGEPNNEQSGGDNGGWTEGPKLTRLCFRTSFRRRALRDISHAWIAAAAALVHQHFNCGVIRL